jgi:hypothetical protein
MGQPGQQVHKVRLEVMVQQEQQVPKDQSARLAQQVHKVQLGVQAPLERQVLQVHKVQ